MDRLDRHALRRRLSGNLLLNESRLDDPAAVVSVVCGVQAQDLAAARLSIRARSNGLTDAGVESARVEQRSIVRTWAMRGTLHLIAAPDVGWLRSLLAPVLIAASARRSTQLGLDEAAYRKSIAVMQRELAGGALTRAQLKPILEGRGVDASGQRLVYLLYRAALEGVICEGAQAGGKPSYVLLRDWLPAAPEGDDGGIDRLLRRYLAAFEPAGPEDLAAWSGLPVAACRAAFEQAAGDLVQLRVGGRPAWVLKGPAPEEAQAKTEVRLLPAFDTFLLGYRKRDLHLEPAFARRVNAGGGIVKPVVLADGRVAGTWRLVRESGSAEVRIDPFHDPAPPLRRGLQGECDDIGRFLGAAVSLKIGPASARV